MILQRRTDGEWLPIATGDSIVSLRAAWAALCPGVPLSPPANGAAWVAPNEHVLRIRDGRGHKVRFCVGAAPGARVEGAA